MIHYLNFRWREIFGPENFRKAYTVYDIPIEPKARKEFKNLVLFHFSQIFFSLQQNKKVAKKCKIKTFVQMQGRQDKLKQQKSHFTPHLSS